MPTAISLIDNQTLTHKTSLLACLKEAHELWVLTAFLKQSGLSEIHEALVKFLNNPKHKATLIAGLDFCITDPEALKKLFKLSKTNKNLHLYVMNEGVHRTFHPKIYFWSGKNGSYAMIGSANLTSGGLERNHEVSFRVPIPKNTQLEGNIRKYMTSIIASPRCSTVSEALIAKYRSKYRRYQKMMAEAIEKHEISHSSFPMIDSATLRKEVEQYKADSKVQNNWQEKQKNYKQAKKLLRSLAKEGADSKAAFLSIYVQLVGGKGQKALWESGNLFRAKNRVAKHYAKFVSMLRDIESSINDRQQDVLGKALKHSLKIEGLGINVITEILNTLSPTRFPVMNGNSTTSLAALGYGRFGSRNKKSIDPNNYSRLTAAVDELSNLLGFEDFSRADHFLNYVYWQIKKRRQAKTKAQKERHPKKTD